MRRIHAWTRQNVHISRSFPCGDKEGPHLFFFYSYKTIKSMVTLLQIIGLINKLMDGLMIKWMDGLMIKWMDGLKDQLMDGSIN